MAEPDNNKLYKYRPFSARALDMLANNKLYLAPTARFNDPFDCYNIRDFVFPNTDEKFLTLQNFEMQNFGDEVVQPLEEIKNSKEKQRGYLKLRKNGFIEIVMQSIGVCSFSEINDDILMWSHYSNGHKGFCLEFERNTNKYIPIETGKVQYPHSYEFPELDDAFWYHSQKKALEAAGKIILTKSPHWEYEKEWRMIDNKVGQGKYNGHLLKYPIEMISGIIYGYKMSENNKTTIRKIIKNKNITTYEAKPVKDKFQVKIVRAK